MRIIPLLQHLIEIDLVRLGQTAHQLRIAQRQLIATVDLPEMPGLAVETYDFSHGFCFEFFPFVGLGAVGDRGGQYKHAGFDLELLNVSP